MRRTRIAALVAALAFVGAVPIATEAHSGGVPAGASKSCSSGYVHAVLPTGHKCLRRGQYCAKRYDRIYHRYGFHCHRSGRLS